MFWSTKTNPNFWHLYKLINIFSLSHFQTNLTTQIKTDFCKLWCAMQWYLAGLHCFATTQSVTTGFYYYKVCWFLFDISCKTVANQSQQTVNIPRRMIYMTEGPSKMLERRKGLAMMPLAGCIWNENFNIGFYFIRFNESADFQQLSWHCSCPKTCRKTC